MTIGHRPSVSPTSESISKVSKTNNNPEQRSSSPILFNSLQSLVDLASSTSTVSDSGTVTRSLNNVNYTVNVNDSDVFLEFFRKAPGTYILGLYDVGPSDAIGLSYVGLSLEHQNNPMPTQPK